MRRVIASCLLALGSLGVAACGSSSSSTSAANAAGTTKGPIVIGAAVAKSGFMVAYDGAPFQGFELGVKDINAQGGIDGRRLEIVSSDTASSQAQAKTAADDVIGKGAQVILASADYDYGGPAALEGEARGLLTLSLGAQSLKWGVQGLGPSAYTPATSTFTEGWIAAQWAKSKGWTRAFVLNDPTTAYDTETCTGFTDRFKQLGGSVVGTDTFHNGDPSIASQISAIKSATPQFIRICSYVPGIATALRQIRAAGITVPVVGNAADDGSYWLKSVPSLSGFFYPAHASIYGDDPSSAVNRFVKEFTAAYGQPPATSYALFGYLDAQIIADAVKQAGSTDGSALAKVLNGWSNKQLILPTAFTPQIHIVMNRPMAMIEIQNGKPRYLGEVKLTTAPPFKLG